MFSKVSWYFQRLKKVPLKEFPYRVNVILKKILDNYFFKTQYEKFPYKAKINLSDISTLIEKFPEIKNDILRNTESILEHRFEIFGIKKGFGNPINWSLDPKTGKTWPCKFWGKINYRDGKTFGGIKFAWELNRLHHFPHLALAYRVTKNEKYKDEIFLQLKSWLQDNPYPLGINWIMGIELGIRLVNLVYTMKFLGDVRLKPHYQDLISYFVFLHGRHLYRYTSKFSSCANHCLAEALGLFIAGICFPEIKGAKRWKKKGKKVLEREVVRQIYPDGSSFEHSIPYLQFVLDNFLVYYLFCLEYKEPVSEVFKERLKAAFEFINHILDREGNYPLIGDDDDGFLLKFWFKEQNNFVSLLNTGAILFDRPEWIPDNAGLDCKTYLLLGKNTFYKYKRLKAADKLNNSGCRCFSDSGLVVARDDSDPEILIVSNNGPLGLKPLGGHGHADALSFWLSVKGQPVFIDPGTYLYHSGGKWRNYFRSTRAHNTICVDGLDQAEIVSDFIFRDFYRVKGTQFEETEGSWTWGAAHSGYMRLRDPVFHERKISYQKKDKCIYIKDNISCNSNHLIKCFFHLHPSCAILSRDNFFTIMSGNINVRLEAGEKWTSYKLFKGSTTPLSGWFSPGFNKLKESYTIRLSADIKCSESFMCRIFLG